MNNGNREDTFDGFLRKIKDQLETTHDQCKGKKWEITVRDAFIENGYYAEREGVNVWGQEGDVVARQDDRGKDRYYIQCKNYDSNEAYITPADMWRLIAFAFTLKAEPIMAHTTELTTNAQEIAESWNVRILDFQNLEKPHIIQPPIDQSNWPEKIRKFPDLLANDLPPMDIVSPTYTQGRFGKGPYKRGNDFTIE